MVYFASMHVEYAAIVDKPSVSDTKVHNGRLVGFFMHMAIWRIIVMFSIVQLCLNTSYIVVKESFKTVKSG